MKPDSKIVIRVNECDARKGTKGVDDAWINASRFVDGAIFVSDWLRDYFLERGWHCKNNVVIYNGVNKEIFKPSEKLNDGKIHIVSAHWSDNPLKGQDVTEWLDDFVGKHPEYAFTFVGRTKAKLTNGSVVGPLSGKKLGEELAKHHVCVNGSRFDPGPNSVIEPIACGLPTYVHKDGGGGVEFAGKSHVFNDVFSLEKLLLTNQFQQNLTSFDDWEIVVKRYVDFVVNLSV
jgi:glycosyltransferase involved in cell wall biosynthesis